MILTDFTGASEKFCIKPGYSGLFYFTEWLTLLQQETKHYIKYRSKLQILPDFS